MIGDIDLSKKPQKIELFLTKPDRTVIAKLKEAYGTKQTVKLGNVNELTFTIPYTVEVGHENVENPNIELLRDRYFIKAVVGKVEDWYIITSIEESMDDSNEAKNITAYSLPYEMTSKMIRGTKLISVNIDTALNGGRVLDEEGDYFDFDGLLASTKWKLGYVDSKFAVMFRTYDFSSSTTILDALFKVAETTMSIIVWDTVNRKINFHDPLNYGNDRGLSLNYGRYLKSLKLTKKGDEMTTVFKVFGENDISIQDVNITGQNYLEDYSFFLYPFKRDDNRNVIQHSYYMTDALCHALLDFNAFVESKAGQFNALYNNSVTYKTQMRIKDNELNGIKDNLDIAKNNIDLAASKGESTAQYVAQRDSYQAQYNAKMGEITTLQGQIDNTASQIQTLRSSMQYSKFFTPTLLDELKDYQIVKEYTNTNVSNVATQELMDLAKKEFEYLKTPQVTLSIDIVNFLDIVEAQRDWDKLVLGDIINVHYGHMNVNVTAKIIEYSIDHEQSSITITIANVKDILTDEQKLIKMLYNSSSASTTLDMSKSKWDSISATRSTVDQIINNTWDANKRIIEAGINNSVSISQRGIMITNPDDPNNYLIAQNGILAITNDRGNTWKNAITKDGIVAERLFGKLIAGVNLTIDASDSSGQKLFTVDGNGVTITGTKLTILGGLPQEQIDPAFVDSISHAIDDLQTDVENMLSDGQLTAIEANVLIRDLAQIKSESQDLISIAVILGITSEKDAYNNAVNDLDRFLTDNFIGKPEYPIEISPSQRIEIKNRMSSVQNSKSILINQIAAVREQRAKDASVGLGRNYNGVVIDAQNGLVITTGDNSIRTKLNATEGFKFQKNIGGTWTDQLFYDALSGNLTMLGVINAKDFLIGGSSVLTQGGTKLNGQYIDSITTGQLTVTTKLGDEAINSAGVWNGKTTYLTPSGIYTGTLTANQINAINGISLGANATIDWSYMNSDPKVSTAQSTANGAQSTANSALTAAQQIVAGTYTGGSFISGKIIYAPDLRGGSITSNTSINVGTDVNVGNNITMRSDVNPSGDKAIVFYGKGDITFRNSGVTFGANQSLNFSTSLLYWNGDILATQSWVNSNVYAKFG